MQIQQLGSSRTSHQGNHLFQTPDSFVRAPLPGMQEATAIIHAGPALGAAFLEYTAEMKAGGKLGETAAQRFFYVASGAVELDGHPVPAGGYGFVPQGEKHEVTAGAETSLVVIEKRYEALGDGLPRRLTGGGDAVIGRPLMGDEDVQVQPLIPDNEVFDFAVNLITFAPEAALCMVEAHIMEHGLMMLQGGGIYRLGDFWYPTTAGDFIWMGAILSAVVRGHRENSCKVFDLQELEQAPAMNVRIDPDRLESEHQELAGFSETPSPAITRIVFSKEDVAARSCSKRSVWQPV